MHINTMHTTIEVDDTVHTFLETADYSPHAGNCTHHDKMLQKQCMN